MSETTEKDEPSSNKILATNFSHTLMPTTSTPATPLSPLVTNLRYRQKFELYHDVIEEKLRDTYPELPQTYELKPTNIECSTMKGYDLDFPNDSVVIQHHSVPFVSLVNSSMTRRLVYRTNKEFDKYAELLRNILSVQESRRNAKYSVVREINWTKRRQSSMSMTPKKQNSEAPINKSSVMKSNTNGITETSDHQPCYSVNKTSRSIAGVTLEEVLLSNVRGSSNKSRKRISRSPSPTQKIHQRLASISKNNILANNKYKKKSTSSSLYQRTRNNEELVRSSSCIDPSSFKSNFMHRERRSFHHEQFITYLTRIRTISKQIRSRDCNNFTDPQYYHLWNELENCLSSALLHVNDDIQFQSSSVPVQREMIELRKQLEITNLHLHEYNSIRRNDEPYVHLQKKFDTNQIQYTQSLLHNKELKTKCQLLQDKIDHLERNNIRLIQRLTQQDLRSLAKCTVQISKDNELFLHEEIMFLKEKLYHIYDDLVTLSNRNHTLENSIKEQNQQLLLYEHQINNLKQSAKNLLHDLNNHSIEDQVQPFLNNIQIDQKYDGVIKNSFQETQITSTKSASSVFKPASILFEIPPTVANRSPFQSSTFQSYSLPIGSTNNARETSLFVNPPILNDSNVLSKFQYNKSPNTNTACCSSSTIDDADSILVSSFSTLLSYDQRKRNTFCHSLPLLPIPTNIDITKTPKQIHRQHISNDDSDPDFDQISDLTSKMFNSEDEADFLIVVKSTSTSSSTNISADAEKLAYM
ncbi:unnamed protein product [Rotaria socialis]|uniref:Uncharacterized protein n=1 Tax=Rotaria socialis TaxID=392032 RepID=A0A818XG08_9BILA|nr:unnamed protein product [Rotaria socialis]CAF4202121.1 unnamed protein product [Rotaria socialis]